jgi:hypothetical protein
MLRTMRDNAFNQAQDTPPRRGSEDRDRFSVGWTVACICGLLALLVAVNILPQGVGITLSRGESGQWLVRPALEASPSLINLWLSLSLALNLTNLYYRRWQPATRWADFGLSVLAVFVLLQLFSGFLTGVSSIHVVPQPGDAPTALAQIVQNPGSWSMLVASVALPVALLYTLFRSAHKLLRLARG